MFESTLGQGLLSKFTAPPTADFGTGRLLQGLGGFEQQQVQRLPQVNTTYYALKPKPLDFAAIQYMRNKANGTWMGYAPGGGGERNVNQYRAIVSGNWLQAASPQGVLPPSYG